MMEDLFNHQANIALYPVVIRDIIIISISIDSRPLQTSTDQLSTLPGVTSLQRLPSRDRTSLDANHLLVRLVGAEISNCFGLFYPRVPDNNVVQGLASNGKERLVAVCRRDDDGDCGIQGLVDTVCFANDGQGGLAFGVRGCVLNLVDVGLRFEVVDADLGDVLFWSVK